ncbi:BadF/BadG/BcrA/BcrD ATPase family protein [Desulfosporosinus fructosivorans]
MGIKIGVDGGGSKTEIVALDQTGRVLRSLRKPASNYHLVGMEQATQNIIEGIRDALQEESVQGIGISLAGIDTPEDWKNMADNLKGELLVLGQKTGVNFQDIPVALENDVYGALMSVRGEFSGNVLAAGTGAVALGIDPEGRVIRVGGWGHLIGDQGGGYDIGRKALVAMAASFDEYGPKSLLESTITKHLGLARVPEIIDWLYQAKRTNKEVAALVPVVVETASRGDAISRSILVEAGVGLGLLTRALLRKTKTLKLGIVGGIGNVWGHIESSFISTVSVEFPTLQILKPIYTPSVGAALLSTIDEVRHIEF